MIKKVFIICLYLFTITGMLSGCEGKKTEEPQPTSVTEHNTEENLEEEKTYLVEGDNLYINDTTNFFEIEDSAAKTMILKEPISFQDFNAIPMDGVGTAPIYDSYFSHCSNISKIRMADESDFSVKNGELYAEDNMLFYKNPKKGIYACPVTREGTVKISKGIWDIYDCAFQKCSKIKKVELPKSVRWIGDAAFGCMTGCDEISVDESSQYLKSIDGVLYTKDGEVLIAYPAGKKDKVFQVPEGVRIIADGAFMGAENLEKIKLTRNMFYIGERAFMDCKNLEEYVTSKDKVTYIMNSAYEGCSKFQFAKRPKRKSYATTNTEALVYWKNRYKELSYLEDAAVYKCMYHYVGKKLYKR